VLAGGGRGREGFDEVLVLAPLPRNHGPLASGGQEVRRLSARQTVHLIVPDDPSQEAIGPNIYDPSAPLSLRGNRPVSLEDDPLGPYVRNIRR
jgi:hypothetical protein